ncbi:TM2 domain-containing protein [uncultured Alistipes sp.]|uniref:TM2 domain-containing protein n=1 Tax=uncultured Alistipes sp. TaxID=538949 RepID=UPI0025F3ED38|nr:TM2 domain-containing protein [uncultured Alistipes sp.]
MFCSHCGLKIEDTARFCPHCGADLQGRPSAVVLEESQNAGVGPAAYRSRKEKAIALILCFLLGCWGGHRFYLGEKASAVTMFVIGLFGLFLFIPLLITGVWSLIDLIRILIMDPAVFEARYNSDVR